MYDVSFALPVEFTSFSTTFFEFNSKFNSLIDSFDNESKVYAFPLESLMSDFKILFIKLAFPSDTLFSFANLSISSSSTYICDKTEPCIFCALNNSFISFVTLFSNSFALLTSSFFTDTNTEF